MKVERIKIGYGADGALQDVTAAAPLPITDAAVIAALATILGAVDGLEGKDYATQATLAALLTSVNLTATTEAAVLAKLSADPATQATLAAVLTKLNASLAVTGPLTDTQLRASALSTAPSSAGDVATTLTDGRKTVTAAGTAEAIRSSLACRWVTVTALLTNTAQVNVGGSGVLATLGASTGTPLEAGQGMTVPVDNASKVFVDARVSSEGVSFTVAS